MNRIITIFTLLAVVASNVLAQNALERKRMTITLTDGTTRVYDVSRIDHINFAEGLNARVDLTLNKVAGYSLTVDATPTENCGSYVLAVAPATEAITDTAAYILQHISATETDPKTIELGGLQPQTDYIVLALAFDIYGIPCGTSSLSASTVEATDAEKPKVGYILYADGSWSRRLVKGRNPIGIIFAVSTTEADQANGWTMGYAMALNDAAAQLAWATTAAEHQAGGDYTSAVEKGFLTDLDGYTHTVTLMQNASRHPAAAAACAYTAPTPARSSGWYLPSSGQWHDICVNLGGIDDMPNVVGNTEGYWNTPQVVSNTLNLINEHMSIAGSGNYTPITVPSGDYLWYWCSSESSGEQAYAIFFDQDQLVVEIAPYFKTYAFSTNRVRPVIAF